MQMAMIETWFDQDLLAPVPVHVLNGVVFDQDSLGNLIGVRITKDGEPVTLTGSVNGYCILSDGSTIPVDGSRDTSGNRAWIVLPQSAYLVLGSISIVIKLTDGNTITTLCACVGTVRQSKTSNMVEPSSTVITDWSQQISAELQACQDAADNMGANLASTYSTTATYPVGSYVMYDGTLYRCVTAVTTAGSWSSNSSKFAATKLGDDVSALKSAFDANEVKTDSITYDLYDYEYIGADQVTGFANGCIFTTAVGEAITFGTEPNLRHCYITVSAGEIYRIGLRKWETTKRYHIAFTDSNGTVLALYEKGNGTSSTVIDIYAVPTGATRLYTFAKTSAEPSASNPYWSIKKAVVKYAEEDETQSKFDNVWSVVRNNNLTIMDNAETPVYNVCKSDIELGTFTDGEEQPSSNRARNRNYIHVYPGDIIASYRASNAAYTFAVLYYNLSYVYQSQSGWALLSGTHAITIETEGFIRLLFNPSNTGSSDEQVKEYFNGTVAVIRSAGDKKANLAYLDRYDPNTLVRTIKSEEIAFGAINPSDGSIAAATSRGATPSFIPVNPGDAIRRKKSAIGVIISFYDASRTFIRSNSSSYSFFDYQIVVQPGDSYIRIGYKNNDTDTPLLTDFDGIVSITRFAEKQDMLTLGILNRVEYSKPDECVHGYINPNTGGISSHAKYMAVQKFFRVRPGDIVRCANFDLNVWVMEYDLSFNPVRHNDGYIRKRNKNPYPAGEWHVKTDGYVRAHFTNYNAQTEVDIDTYGNSLEVVHSLSALNEYDAVRTKWVTPDGNVKARKIRQNQDITAQGGVIIDGYLYIGTDDYAGNYTIQKVDIQTGATLKTYPHNLGHCSCLDYCEKTDTLLTHNGNFVLYPNFSQALSGDSFDIANCIQIANDLPADSGWCFGEDEYTLYGFHGYDSVTHAIGNIAYKVKLGFGDNDLSANGYGTYTASETYNGTAELVKTYIGEIREDHDGNFGGSNASYAQDCKYDGYLYLCYGTDGYNCFVIDFDDRADMYHVVGNYKWVYRDYDYSEHRGEAECVAFNGSKIVSVLRHLATSAEQAQGITSSSCMFEFER